MAAGTPTSKFDLATYESPRAPTPYIDRFKDSESYFSPKKSSTEHLMRQASLRRGEPDLLRQATTAAHDESHPPPKILSPQEQHPELQLSGRMISASICIRYALGFSDQSEWVRWLTPCSAMGP